MQCFRLRHGFFRHPSEAAIALMDKIDPALDVLYQQFSNLESENADTRVRDKNRDLALPMKVDDFSKLSMI